MNAVVKKEALNLRSKQFDLHFHKHLAKKQDSYQVVEVQPKTHKKMVGLMRTSGSSFNVEPIKVIKDIIESYQPDLVILDDFTNVPGVIEVITTDLKIPVLLDSDMNREIIRFQAE